MTILEFLIYLALFSIIVAISVTGFSHLWITCMDYSNKRVSVINLYTAHDLLARDIRAAPADKKQWKCMTPSSIIWHATNKKDIGWAQEGSNLVRIEGIYAATQKKWKKKTKNIVAKSMQTVRFDCVGNEADEKIDRVSYTIADKRESITSTILLANRQLPWKEKPVQQ